MVKGRGFPRSFIVTSGTIRGELGRCVVWISGACIVAVVTAVASVRRIRIVAVVTSVAIIRNGCVGAV